MIEHNQDLYKSTRVLKDQYERNNRLNEALSEIKSFVTFNGLQKSFYDSVNNMWIDDSYSNYLTSGNYDSYTFNVYIPDSLNNKINNLVFSKQADSTYKTLLYTYHYNSPLSSVSDKSTFSGINIKTINTSFSKNDTGEISGFCQTATDCDCIRLISQNENSPAVTEGDYGMEIGGSLWYVRNDFCPTDETLDSGASSGGGGGSNSGSSGGPSNFGSFWGSQSGGSTMQPGSSHPNLGSGCFNCDASGQPAGDVSSPDLIFLRFESDNYPGMELNYPYNWWDDNDWMIQNIKFFNPETGAFDETPTPAELLLFAQYPVEAVIHIRNADTAIRLTNAKISNGTFPANGIEDGLADAFRHGLWNALSTAEIGSVLTLQFTTAHESEETNRIRKVMDLYNNAVGVAIGAPYNLFTSNDTIAAAVLTGIYNGDFKYIKNTDGLKDLVPTNQ